MNLLVNKYLGIFILLLTLGSCKNEELVTYLLPPEPIVRLISPQNDQVISDSVSIAVETYDDKGLTWLGIYIDDQLEYSDKTNDTIHEYLWDTSYLQEGSKHKIKAKGFDADGNSTTSKEAEVTVYRFTPSNLNAHLLTDSTIELTWQDNSKFETGFEIEQAVNDTLFTKIAALDSNTISYVVKGNFSPEQKYQYRIRAFFNNTPSWYSNTASATLFLFAPTNLSVNFENDTTAVLNWTDNCFFEEGFEIEMSTNFFPFEKIATVEKNAASVKINRVFLLSQNYRFRIRANSKSFYSGYTNIYSLQLEFQAPSDLSLQQMTETSIKLGWKDNSTYEEEFVIERVVGSESPNEIARVSKNVTSYINTGLDVTKNYKYFIFARSKHNASNYATIKTAFTPSFELSKSIDPGIGAIQNFAVSPDGGIIATEGYSGNSLLVKLYEASDGSFLRSTTPIDSIPSFVFGMNKISFSEDGKVVTALTDSPYLYLWNVGDGSLIRKVSTQLSYSELEFSPDLKTFIGVSARTLYFWNYVNGVLEKSISNFSPFGNLTFDSNGNYFATGSDCCIALWNAANRSISKYISSITPARFVHFTKNNEKLFSAKNGVISVWNVSDESLENQFNTDAYNSDITLSADEKFVFTCTGSAILSYRSDSGEYLNESSIENGIYSLFITSDGQTAIGKSFNRISILNIKNKWQKLN